MWAHLPAQYTQINVTGKWLAIACKCTIHYMLCLHTYSWPESMIFDLDPVSFDLDPRDIWPPGHMSNTQWLVLEITIFWHCDLDLWPMTLTSVHGLDIKIWYIVAKFRVASYYTFWDMNYLLVWILVKSWTDGQMQSDAQVC